MRVFKPVLLFCVVKCLFLCLLISQAFALTTIVVVAPLTMSMSHANPGTSSSLVTVTSTDLSWTLTIADLSGSNGKMSKTSGSGPATLSNPLQWSTDNVTFNNLTSSQGVILNGSLVQAKTVFFKQAIAMADNVSSGANYSVTATYTVT